MGRGRGFFGAGITWSNAHAFGSVTVERKRSAHTAMTTELGASYFSVVR